MLNIRTRTRGCVGCCDHRAVDRKRASPASDTTSDAGPGYRNRQDRLEGSSATDQSVQIRPRGGHWNEDAARNLTRWRCIGAVPVASIGSESAIKRGASHAWMADRVPCPLNRHRCSRGRASLPARIDGPRIRWSRDTRTPGRPTIQRPFEERAFLNRRGRPLPLAPFPWHLISYPGNELPLRGFPGTLRVDVA